MRDNSRDKENKEQKKGEKEEAVVNFRVTLSRSVTNIARSVARLGDDDGVKSHAEDVTDILLACDDAFQDEGSESSEPASEGSSASSTFCDLEKNYSKVRVNLCSSFSEGVSRRPKEYV